MLCRAASARARRRRSDPAISTELLPRDTSSGIGFRFFTLRLLTQHRWSGLLSLPALCVPPIAATDVADLEECQRVVDEHMAEERRRKEKRGKDVVAEVLSDWDSGFSDG